MILEIRLRGLEKGHEYAVSVKVTGDTRIERAGPAVRKVTVDEVDIAGQDFIVFRRAPKSEITGEVIPSDPAILPTLTVTLLSDANQPIRYLQQSSFPVVVANADMVLSRNLKLGPNSFFSFGGVARDASYIVRVTSTLSQRTHAHSPVDVPVTLKDTAYVHINFTATPHPLGQHDITQSPFYSLLFAALLIALAVYRKTV